MADMGQDMWENYYGITNSCS